MEIQINDIILCLFSMIVYTITSSILMHYKFMYLHESGISIIFGSIIAIFFHLLNVKNDTQFNQNFFFYFVLPPILLSAGYHLNKQHFFTQIKFILIFGIIGTIFNFIFIASLTFLANYLEIFKITYDRDNINTGNLIKLSFQEILFLSSTLCASDSVAALVYFNQKKTFIDQQEYPKIYSILLGEGVINDAVSIIIFKSISIFDFQEFQISFKQIMTLVQNFFYISICSLLIGFFMGGVHAFILKKLRFISENAYFEISLTFLFGLLTYLICQTLQLSGILAILTCGIMISHYSFHNMSVQAKAAVGLTLNTLSHLAEGILFFYLGITIFEKNSVYSIVFIITELIIVLISRFFSIFGLVLLLNLINLIRRVQFEQLKIQELMIISFGGSVRGAVAYALIISLDNQQSENIKVIKNCVLYVVLTSTILLGGGMGKIQQYFLKSLENDNYSEKSQYKVNHRKTHKIWRSLDDNYLRPLFIYKYDQYQQHLLEQEIRSQQIGFQELSHQTEFSQQQSYSLDNIQI